jgi:NADH-quinone oxidoreductase subunit A
VNFELIEKIFPLAITLLLAVSVPAAVLLLSGWLGAKRPTESKLSSYECGIQAPAQEGDARHRFNVKFYLLAMCFLVFDVEIVFLFPWAVLFQRMSWGGFGVMLGFLGVLTFGWFYLLKRGAFEWE